MWNLSDNSGFKTKKKKKNPKTDMQKATKVYCIAQGTCNNL